MSEITESLNMHLDYATAGLDAASITEIIECASTLRKLQASLYGPGSKLISAARNSGTRNNATRKIKGKAPIGPLADVNEPDADFKHWCDLGSLLCILIQTNDVFAVKRREVMSASYRFGKTVIEVIAHAKQYPHAYRPKGGTGAYYETTR
ncbi:MAG: hypothetical protein COA69_04465 [Robiginitomaculum sp.]|nr:MAG: hypothetical protein COA69_04465 [Robiginitomaculum sp.]